MRIITHLLIACYILTCNIGFAQTANYNGAVHYPFQGSSSSFIYLSGGTAVPALIGDEVKAEVPIGFTFNFAGLQYDKVYASSNGWVSFKNVSPESSGNYYWNTTYSNLDELAPVLLPFWDDMVGINGTSSASYKTTGSAPNRVFTLEYKNWRLWSPSSVYLSIQVILHENGGNNQIEYRYKREAGNAASASAAIGIANTNVDYKILTGYSTNPWFSNSTNFNSYTGLGCPPTNASYFWGCHTNISSVPQAKTICANASTTFSVTSGNANYYQWQVRTGSGVYQDLSNNSTYSGVNTNTLTVSNATIGMNQYTYRCRMSAPITHGCLVASNPGMLYVNTNIAEHPANKTVCEGNAATFSADAVGVGISYQWQVNTGVGGFQPLSNGADYNNVGTKTLSVTNPTGAMDGYLYRCEISSSCAIPTYTNNATLNVNTVPLIVNTLNDKIGCEGSSVHFDLNATGSALSYQWQEDAGSGFSNLSSSTQYAGANTNSLTINNLAVPMTNYVYRCVVSGVCGSPATSNQSMLTVHKPTAVVTQPAPKTTVCDSIDFKLHVKAQGGLLNYQWMESINNSPYVAVPNFGVFSGADTDTLTFSTPPNAMTGRKYICMIAGACGTASSNSASIVINENPEVQMHPADDSVVELQPAYFSVTAIGTNAKYQWQVNDNSGWQDLFDNFAHEGTKTNLLKIVGTYVNKDGYLYRCIVSGACGDNDTSGIAVLAVSPKPSTNINTITTGNNNITLYPNPVKGSEIMLQIDNPKSKNIHYRIIDQLGRLITENDLVLSSQNTSPVNIIDLQPGIYNFVVTEAEQTSIYTLRFTKL